MKRAQSNHLLINFWSELNLRWLQTTEIEKHKSDYNAHSFTDAKLKYEVVVPEPDPEHLFFF